MLTMLFWEDSGRALELWTRKAIEFLELSELFWRSLEDKNVECSTDNGGLAYKFQRSKGSTGSFG